MIRSQVVSRDITVSVRLVGREKVVFEPVQKHSTLKKQSDGMCFQLPLEVVKGGQAFRPSL